MRAAAWTTAVLAGVLAAGVPAGCGPRLPERVPGEHWSWKSLEAAGFCRDRLAALARKLEGIGCIVQGGEMVYAWGDVRTPQDAGSAAKPIYAHLLMKAVETGRIASLDEPVVQWVPEIGGLNPELDLKDQEMTFRHLVNQVSGYGLVERPGEAFAYNDYGMGLLAWTLSNRVFDESPEALLNGELLGEAIGFSDRPTVGRAGSKDGRIAISARDLARFTLLYLRGGHWDGRPVVCPDLYREAMRPGLPQDFPRTSGEEAEHWEDISSIGGGKDAQPHLGHLHFSWWFNRRASEEGRLLPAVPQDAFMGSGWGGRALMVAMPGLDMVVVWFYVRPQERRMWTPLSERGRFKVNELLRELLAARVE